MASASGTFYNLTIHLYYIKRNSSYRWMYIIVNLKITLKDYITKLLCCMCI